MIIFLFLILFQSVAYAGQAELDAEKSRISRKGKARLTAIEETQLITRGWRDRRDGEFDPPVNDLSRPSDYLGQLDRGTVEYHPNWNNYSHHKVKIPNGTTIEFKNFSQIEPGTDAIDRTPGIYGHNLTFKNCNLSNVKSYPDWNIINSNTAQVDQIGTVDKDKEEWLITDHAFVASRYENLPEVRVRPLNALKKTDI